MLSEHPFPACPLSQGHDSACHPMCATRISQALRQMEWLGLEPLAPIILGSQLTECLHTRTVFRIFGMLIGAYSTHSLRLTSVPRHRQLPDNTVGYQSGLFCASRPSSTMA